MDTMDTRYIRILGTKYEFKYEFNTNLGMNIGTFIDTNT
jgi:hypothetical protein